MIYPFKQAGFTLIELLVVMAISSAALALVGGLSVDAYTKYQAKSELMKVKQLVLKAKLHSFIFEESLSLSVENKDLRLMQDDKEIVSSTFNYLHFEKQIVAFNKLGYSDKNSLELLVLERIREINLRDE